MIDAGTLVTVGLAIVGLIGWLWRLHGRLSTEEAVRHEQVTGLRDRLNSFEQRIYDVLERIETKIDQKADRQR